MSYIRTKEGAVVNTDMSALTLINNRRREFKKQQKLLSELAEVKDELTTIKNLIAKITSEQGNKCQTQ